jgi:hypothetical protein
MTIPSFRSLRSPLVVAAACLVLPFSLMGCSGPVSTPNWTAPATSQSPTSAAPTESSEPTDSDTKTQGLWIELPEGVPVEQTGGGFDEDGIRWVEYEAFDDNVAIAIMGSPLDTPASDAEIKEYVTENPSSVDASWSIREDAELSRRYTYPVRQFEFYAGSDDDMRLVVGLYIETDAGGFIVAAAFTDDITESQRSTVVDDWFHNLRFVEV